MKKNKRRYKRILFAQIKAFLFLTAKASVIINIIKRGFRLNRPN